MKKYILAVCIFVIAFIVLLVSVFYSSAITYPVSDTSPQTNLEPGELAVNYPLPYAGKVLPDSPLWPLKALRDKIWFGITTSHIRRAQLALLFSDKRLVMSQKLFEKGKPEIAMSTFTKAEKYLPIAVEEELIARGQGINTDDFLIQLATAALKHKEVTEDLIYLAPENARPYIISTKTYADDTYEMARNALNSRGIPAPKNPFERE